MILILGIATRNYFCRSNFYDYISEEQDRMVLKLCDFGLARIIDRTGGMTSDFGRKPNWTAPEVFSEASRPLCLNIFIIFNDLDQLKLCVFYT
jgi:hypothetical protein